MWGIWWLKYFIQNGHWSQDWEGEDRGIDSAYFAEFDFYLKKRDDGAQSNAIFKKQRTRPWTSLLYSDQSLIFVILNRGWWQHWIHLELRPAQAVVLFTRWLARPPIIYISSKYTCSTAPHTQKFWMQIANISRRSLTSEKPTIYEPS